MNKICCVFLILTVLAFAGTGCQDKTTSVTKARVEFRNTVEGNFFFIPEGSTAGYTKMEPDSLGNYIYEVDLKVPGYFRYVGVNKKFYLVYLTPGARMEIQEGAEGVVFAGDNAAENMFLSKNVYLGSVPEDIPLYSAEWERLNTEEVNRLIANLDVSGLNPDFIRLQTLKYHCDFYLQKLNGPANTAMFAPQVKIELSDNFYDFVKEVNFSDSSLVQIPKWFNMVLGTFEQMEKKGWIEVSPDKYMEIYAKRIANEKVRSMFLVELLNFTLQKGYSDDFPSYLEGVRQYITHPEALEALPALEARYQESKETHKTIARGQMAPEFKAVDVKGKEYTSADFKGKVMVLDFWFTGCIPCRAEMPYMEKLADDMQGENIVFISMSVDTGDELMSLWRKMVKDKKGAELQLNVPGGFKSDLVKKYLIHGVPRIVIVDKEGKIVDANAKRPSDPKLRMQLEQLVK